VLIVNLFIALKSWQLNGQNSRSYAFYTEFMNRNQIKINFDDGVMIMMDNWLIDYDLVRNTC